MTVAQLKAKLDELGVSYTSKQRKAELVKLVESAEATVEQLDNVVDSIEESMERRLGKNISEGWAIAIVAAAVLVGAYIIFF